MRRSFGNSNGGMFRTVGRAVGAGIGGSSSSSSSSTRPRIQKPTTSNLLSLSSSSSASVSSSSSSSLNFPLSATSSAPTWPSSSSNFCDSDEWEWESVDGSEDETANGFYDKFVFGPVPSKDEVQNAVSALQQVLDPVAYSRLIEDRFPSDSDNDVAEQIVCSTGLMHRVPSTGSELDWIEPSLHLNNRRMLQPHGCERVYDALHLLQTEPSVQKMVISLSSDKAVWDAVLNNEVVRELRESVYSDSAENNSLWSSDESHDVAASILMWILDNTKAKIMEFIEKITKLVKDVFQHPDRVKSTAAATNSFEEKLRSSFLLSVVVLLIVVVTRSHRA